MVLSGEDRRNSKQATHFWIFKTSFDNDKVRDHCRFTKPRLKKHIELNTKLQENAKNEFETEFFKSMSNSFVGNTMENIRNCVDVWLVSNRKRTLKLSAKPNLKHLTIFDEKLATTKSELSWCSISQSIVEWASLTSAGLWCMIFTITKSRLRMEIVRSFYSQILTVSLMRLQLKNSTRMEVKILKISSTQVIALKITF